MAQSGDKVDIIQKDLLNGPPVEGEIEERLREPEENETDE